MADKQITPKKPKVEASKASDHTAERKSLKKLSRKKVTKKKLKG